MGRSTVGVLLLFLAVAASFPSSALAHKLNVFAYVEGKAIRGRAYFRGGSPARKARVTAVDPAGHELGQTTTDDDGNFVIEVRRRCDHRVIVDAGDGHGGEATVRAAELPGGLPAGDSRPPGAGGRPAQPAEPAAQPAPPGEVLAEIKALETQVRELRKQIADYEDQVRFRDVLGGLGFILGLAGVTAYVSALKRRPLRLGGPDSLPSRPQPQEASGSQGD